MDRYPREVHRLTKMVGQYIDLVPHSGEVFTDEPDRNWSATL